MEGGVTGVEGLEDEAGETVAAAPLPNARRPLRDRALRHSYFEPGQTGRVQHEVERDGHAADAALDFGTEDAQVGQRNGDRHMH